MTVADLRALLADFAPDAQVLVSCENPRCTAEFHPVSPVAFDGYVAQSQTNPTRFFEARFTTGERAVVLGVDALECSFEEKL